MTDGTMQATNDSGTAAPVLFTRIDTVFLPVRDVSRAAAWYRDTLGLGLLWEQPGVACLKMGETPLTLLQHRFPGVLEPGPEDGEFRPLSDLSFNFYAPDIEASHAGLRERGVQVTEIVDSPGVRWFTAWDLDGNRFGACWWPQE
jgi:catechol 2,3-dioxygenase-like lactoylglutathione lyase family enzyme